MTLVVCTKPNPLWSLFLSVCLTSALFAQNPKEVILAAGASDIVAIIDPSTLQTIAQIHLKFAGENIGLDRVAASFADSGIYVEGPLPSDPKGCCALYFIDLKSLSFSVAGGVPGTHSHNGLVFVDNLILPRSELIQSSSTTNFDFANDFHLSPGGSWLIGVRSESPAIKIFNRSSGQFVRELDSQLGKDWRSSGSWAGKRFYLYAESNDGRGRLWSIFPKDTQLGEGIAIGPLGQTAGCVSYTHKALIAANDKLFLYEPFGFIGDRRYRCSIPISGGVWMVDRTSGLPLKYIAPNAYFSALIADEASSFLYGFDSKGRDGSTSRLLKINAKDGTVLRSRIFDPGYFRIAVGSLRSVPKGDIYIEQH